MGKNDSYYALIGNVALFQTTCPVCNEKAIVLDGETQCCNYPIKDTPERYKVVSCARMKRRTPAQKERLEAIERQNGKCPYCEFPFSAIMIRRKGERKKVVIPNVVMDHFVPYSYSYNNQKVNFVAACSICNGIKSNKIFHSLERAKEYVQKKRDEKGYEPL